MFFSVREDKRMKHRICFKHIRSDTYIGIDPKEADQVKDVTVLFMEGDGQSIYPDVIESPVFMISDRLQRLLAPLDERTVFKRVVLNQVEEEKQALYWLMIPEQMACLAGETEYFPNGWVKKAVIDSSKVLLRRIFQIQLLPRPLFVVNTDVAEAIMRRNFDGVILEPIEAC